jgi:endonuclease/exonuclease/phosphatase family metal-dependent hydrolase
MDSVSAISGKNAIITGDFNDFVQRAQNPTLTELINSSSVVFLTKELRSCRVPTWYGIDHVVANTAAASRWLSEGVQVIPIERLLPKEQAEMVSDHCPVVTVFSTK